MPKNPKLGGQWGTTQQIVEVRSNRRISGALSGNVQNPTRDVHDDVVPELVGTRRPPCPGPLSRPSRGGLVPASPATRVTALLAGGVLAAATAVALAPSASATSPDLVISQMYGGGGNSGAPYTHDFIELFNRGDAPVDVSGWSVQYASASGTSWQLTKLSGSVAPGKFYLVQEAQGAGGTTPLPTPDATGTIAMSGTAGKIALVISQTALTCGADCDHAEGVRDFAGYGGANDFEGAGPTPALSNTTAAVRGNADTDNNQADFTIAAPNPRNSGSSGPGPDPEPAPKARIHEIQGKAHRSPLAGTQVSSVPGVVTA